jgi:hypothetical protein
MRMGTIPRGPNRDFERKRKQKRKRMSNKRIMFEPDPFDDILAEAIAREVCEEFGVTPDEIRSQAKPDRIAAPRQVILALTPGPDETVAQYWNRERTTRRFARAAFDGRYASDRIFRTRVDRIKRRIGMSEPTPTYQVAARSKSSFALAPINRNP